MGREQGKGEERGQLNRQQHFNGNLQAGIHGLSFLAPSLGRGLMCSLQIVWVAKCAPWSSQTFAQHPLLLRLCPGWTLNRIQELEGTLGVGLAPGSRLDSGKVGCSLSPLQDRRRGCNRVSIFQEGQTKRKHRCAARTEMQARPQKEVHRKVDHRTQSTLLKGTVRSPTIVWRPQNERHCFSHATGVNQLPTMCFQAQVVDMCLQSRARGEAEGGLCLSTCPWEVGCLSPEPWAMHWQPETEEHSLLESSAPSHGEGRPGWPSRRERA